ncbi:MAG: ATP-binding protein [Bacteroidetes bacterium]|nr:ATP-binding protein [Bacteroidota bacterium]
MPKPQIPSATFLTKSTHDRGPTPYFHGRRRILRDFAKQLKLAAEEKDGTVFLIQGAPGSGKTALLHECEKLALANGWETTKKKIYPQALWTPSELRKSLGQNIRAKFSGTGGVMIQVAPIGVKAEWAQKTTLSILGSGKKPLLLQLDEAQTIGTTNAPHTPELKSVATNVLQAIHNGELGRPVVLIAAGLGTTSDAFGALGISRFAESCFVELGALSRESERAVIYDWLTKEGGAQGNPTVWIDTIVQETHQWPRHVHSYAKHAAEHLKENGGIMTTQGLNAVIKLGQEGRKQYYKQRVAGFDGDEIACLYEAIASIRSGKRFKKDLILAPLIKKYESDKAESLFKKLIDKGVISTDGILYSVPIPSMHDWMRSELERAKEQMTALQDC